MEINMSVMKDYAKKDYRTVAQTRGEKVFKDFILGILACSAMGALLGLLLGYGLLYTGV